MSGSLGLRKELRGTEALFKQRLEQMRADGYQFIEVVRDDEGKLREPLSWRFQKTLTVHQIRTLGTLVPHRFWPVEDLRIEHRTDREEYDVVFSAFDYDVSRYRYFAGREEKQSGATDSPLTEQAGGEYEASRESQSGSLVEGVSRSPLENDKRQGRRGK